MSDLTSDYFQIVLRSLGFTLAQAFLAAVLSATLGVFFALFACLENQKQNRIQRFVTLWTRFLFSIPGVVAAFLFLQAVDFLGWASIYEGFWAIVLCHVVFSVGWVFSESSFSIRRKIAGGFAEQLESASTLGMTLREQVIRGPLRWLLQREGSYYFYFLFFVYMNSFSTVLILGGGPRYSTLDVLNFFNIQQNASYERLGIVLLLQVGLGLVFGIWAEKKKLIQNESVTTGESFAEESRVAQNFGYRDSFLRAHRFFLFALVLILGLLAFGLGRNFFFNVKPEVFDLELFEATGSTFKFVGASLFWFVFLALVLSSRDLSKYIKGARICLAISPYLFTLLGTMIFRKWSAGDQDSYMVAGFCLVLGWIPWIIFVLHSHLAKCQRECLEAAKVMGFSNWEIFKCILFFYLKPGFIVLAIFISTTCVADIFVSGVLLQNQETLSMLARRWAQRYHFSGMSVIVGFQLILVLLLTRLSKGFKAEGNIYVS